MPHYARIAWSLVAAPVGGGSLSEGSPTASWRAWCCMRLFGRTTALGFHLTVTLIHKTFTTVL